MNRRLFLATERGDFGYEYMKMRINAVDKAKDAHNIFRLSLFIKGGL